MIVVAGLVQRLIDAHTVGDWLWVTAVAFAAVFVAAGVFTARNG